MPLTPAQRIRQQALAAKAAKTAQAAGGNDPYGAPQGSDYELLRARLAEHKRALALIRAKAQKEQYKVDAVKDFDGWVDGVLATGSGTPDPVFTEMLAWNLDAGNHERALEMAAYAIRHKLTMPDQFSRAVPEFVMDEFFAAYNQGKLGKSEGEGGGDGGDAVALLERALEITEDADAHDQPRAKLLKAYGYALIGCKPDSAEFDTGKLDAAVGQQALTALQIALKLDEKSGVKKDIEKLERALKKASQGAT